MLQVVERAEWLVIEAAKTRGTLFAFREPMWVTWPLSRFGSSSSLFENVRFGRSDFEWVDSGRGRPIINSLHIFSNLDSSTPRHAHNIPATTIINKSQ